MKYWRNFIFSRTARLRIVNVTQLNCYDAPLQIL